MFLRVDQKNKLKKLRQQMNDKLDSSDSVDTGVTVHRVGQIIQELILLLLFCSVTRENGHEIKCTENVISVKTLACVLL